MMFLNIPIRMRKFNNTIIIEYAEFNKQTTNVLESNLVFECFQNMAKNYEFKSYYAFLGTQYKREFELLTEEIYKDIEEKFFTQMNENVEKTLGLVLEVMETPLANYLTYCNNEAFNLLKYFAEFEEIPNLNDFYPLKTKDLYAGIYQYKYKNIKRDICYHIYDYTNATRKKDQNIKCKFVVMLDKDKEYNKVVKRCNTFDEALNYIKTKVTFVKGI